MGDSVGFVSDPTTLFLELVTVARRFEAIKLTTAAIAVNKKVNHGGIICNRTNW